MKNAAAFLVLLSCLSGVALGETQPAAEQQQCTTKQDTASTQGDPSAPQNQIEYGGGG